ncbi:MAG: glycoside hydrolase family 13 protein [Eggerthellaceae bacterium]|nr:glycoside hydrolase family 13 protein [Eggerthellaceae bacterium]
MSFFEQLKWAVGHDPCRERDRSPVGAVSVGQAVRITLRVAESARAFVESAEVLVAEADADVVASWREEPLFPCDDGFAAAIELAAFPHVEFYAFKLLLADETVAYYVPRADGAATAGELVRDGIDGEWSDAGWTYAAERLAGRPAGGFGLPEMTPGFQITVFEPAFKTPDWLAGAIMYQVFPDRFARGAAGVRNEGVAYHEQMGRPVHLHEKWDEALQMTAKPSGDDMVGEREPSEDASPGIIDDEAEIEELGNEQLLAYDPVEFYGGTLSGIREKLPYLASLGVEVLYLNPIFEARSNHRYDTADYEHIDPLLGSDDDFTALVAEARESGISIVLDAVLSHTGDDSRYFNAHGSYDVLGAAQGEGSPYRSWYDFAEDDDSYRCWWGDPTLPEVNERDASWQRYILGVDEWGNPDGSGVLARWLAAGACGFRLDVADEIPDDVLARLRTSVKRANPEAVIIGEVWEDATTKVSYSERRTYALGHALDSVMNYPLRSALLGFATGSLDARQLAAFLRLQQANYPAPLYRGLMNLLSSHDVERMRSALATGISLREVPRERQLELVEVADDADDAHAARLQRMVVALLYALPGSPCVYYGDECGLQGGSDPFCRATFPWDGEARKIRGDCGEDLTAFYQRIGALRKGSPVLRNGALACVAPDPDVLCVVRTLADEGVALAVANRSDESRRVAFDLHATGAAIDMSEELCPMVSGDDQSAALQIENGVATVRVPACSTVVFSRAS